MVAKRYGNNNNGGKIVVGGSGKSGYANNAPRRNTNDAIRFMVDGKNALIFATQFRTKRNNTPMVRFVIYDFDAKKKYSSAIPLAMLLKFAFPTLQLELTEIGDLTPQPHSQ
jgi:hypothetical protein